MSTEATTYAPITVEQIAAFHKAKSVKTTCDRCGNPTWRMLTSTPLAPATGLPVALTDAAVDPTYFVPTYVLSCSNCGNIWMMERSVFDEWNQPAPAITEEP